MPTHTPTKTSDELLIQTARNERSQTLAKLYKEMATMTQCACRSQHIIGSAVCPKAVWEEAARMATLMTEA